MSAAVSSQGGGTRCQATISTKSIAAQTAARIAQRRHAIVVNKANGTFKHSNQRHGSCTKRSFGRCCHREKVKENINTAGSTDHAAIVHQSRIDSRRRKRDKRAAPASITICAAATRETRILKRL